MKRHFMFVYLILILTAAAWAVPPDILNIIPADSQFVVEIRDGKFLYSVIQETGLDAKLAPAIQQALSEIADGKPVTFTTDDLQKLFNSSLVVAASLTDQGELEPGFTFFTAIQFKDGSCFQQISSIVKPTDMSKCSVSSMGPFTIYRMKESPEPEKEKEKEKGKKPFQVDDITLAVGNQMMVLALDGDLTKKLAKYLAGQTAPGWHEMSLKGEPPLTGTTIARARIVTEKLKYVVKSLVIRMMEKEKEKEQEKETQKEQKEISAEEKGTQSETQVKKPSEKPSEETGETSAEPGPEKPKKKPGALDFPPEAILKFVEGLGLGQIEEGSIVLREDGDKMSATTSFKIDRSIKKFLGQYLDGMEGRSLSVYKYLPEDTVMFNNVAFVDLKLFYTQMSALFKSAFGPQGEMILLSLEAMVPMQTGLSLRDDIFPLLGHEYGVVVAPVKKSAESTSSLLPPAAFFLVPDKIEVVEKCFNTLEKLAGLKITKEMYRDKKVYSTVIGEKAEEAFPLGAIVMDKVVFISPNLALLHKIADGILDGKTIDKNPQMQPYLAKIPPNCIQFALSDMKRLADVLPQIPEDNPLSAFVSLLGKTELEGISHHRVILQDNGIVAQSETSTTTYKNYMKALFHFLMGLQEKKPQKTCPDKDAQKPAETQEGKGKNNSK